MGIVRKIVSGPLRPNFKGIFRSQIRIFFKIMF